MSSAKRSLVFCLLAAAALSVAVRAHDIPVAVTIQAFVKPEGDRLHVLVRVPMRALRDVAFPLRPGGALDLPSAEPALRVAATQWIVNSLEVHEGSDRLASPELRHVRVSLPSDRSFETFDEAAAHMSAPAGPHPADLPWDQGLLDAWIAYPIRSGGSGFAVRPGLERLGVQVVTVLRFLPPGGGVRAFQFTGDPGVVPLDPRWSQAALRFAVLGFRHILDGTDHLLFLVCLVIPFRRLRPLVLVVTGFTVAHSITLLASAAGLAPGALWFPPLVETIIAASIVYMALENIVAPASASRRWAMACVFGLAHGFGFSFALRETLQFAGSHLLTSLVAFNLGVEAGQVFVLVLLVPALALLFRFVVAERIGIVVLSALVAHTGWHWMTERWDQLRQYERPAIDLMVVAWAGRMLIVLMILAGIGWWLAARREGRVQNASR